jgi:mannose-1-phosphate guanylyltransferase
VRTEAYPVNSRAAYDRFRHRWGVILAGGDGKRLLSLTRMIAGDDRPKQFCTIVGGETLLDQTRSRVRRIVRTQQTLVVVTKAHEQFYRGMTHDTYGSQVLVQPANRGTAPAIAYSLERLNGLDPNGIVAIFPSDHHVADEAAFTSDLETAFAAAEARADRVLLLGVSPDYPEAEYGWVEPGAPLGGKLPDTIRGVSCFWEKPSPSLASALMKRGCLWNSFVMIGRVGTFLRLIQRALPKLMSSFEPIRSTYLTAREDAAVRELYSRIPSSGFSDRVLAAYPGDLAVLRGANLGWSDLGEPSRVLAVLDRKGIKPEWTYAYVGQDAHCGPAV